MLVTYHKLICLTLLLSALLLIPGLCYDYALGQTQGISNGTAPVGMKYYFNPVYNASMNYPSNWSVNERDGSP